MLLLQLFQILRGEGGNSSCAIYCCGSSPNQLRYVSLIHLRKAKLCRLTALVAQFALTNLSYATYI